MFRFSTDKWFKRDNPKLIELDRSFDQWVEKFQADASEALPLHVVDVAGSSLSGAVFNKALLAMPVGYRESRSFLKYFAYMNYVEDYKKEIASRSTPHGDGGIKTSQFDCSPFGVELVSCFPEKHRDKMLLLNVKRIANGEYGSAVLVIGLKEGWVDGPR